MKNMSLFCMRLQSVSYYVPSFLISCVIALIKHVVIEFIVK